MILSIARYDSLDGGGPMQTASSARSTCRAFLSASEYTATVRTPIVRAVLMTRQAISPRLAIKIFWNMATSEVIHHGCAKITERRPTIGDDTTLCRARPPRSGCFKEECCRACATGFPVSFL